MKEMREEHIDNEGILLEKRKEEKMNSMAKTR